MLYYMLQIFSSFVAVQVNDVIRNETSMVVSSPDGARPHLPMTCFRQATAQKP